MIPTMPDWAVAQGWGRPLYHHHSAKFWLALGAHARAFGRMEDALRHEASAVPHEAEIARLLAAVDMRESA